MPNLDKNLVLLFFANVIVANYWNMTGPLIPLFIRSLDASVFQVSLVLFAGGLASTLSMVPGGLLSDRYGEKKLIILSTALLAISPLLYSTADTWAETIPYTIINTISLGLFTAAGMIIIANSVKPSSMATAYGLMNIAWPIGGVLGPVLGGFLADNYGWNLFFYFLSLSAFLCMLVSLFLSESDEKHAIKVDSAQKSSFEKGVISILMIFFLVHIFGNTARGILRTVFPFYLTESFHKSKTETGLFFSVGFGIATLVMQFPSGLLADKIGRKKVMTYVMFLTPVITFLFLMVDNYISLLFVYMAITALWSATWPASAAYLMAITQASNRGLTMGVRQTAVRLGFTVGPLIGGFLWDYFDPSTSFYVTTIFFAISFLLILLLKE